MSPARTKIESCHRKKEIVPPRPPPFPACPLVLPAADARPNPTPPRIGLRRVELYLTRDEVCNGHEPKYNPVIVLSAAPLRCRSPSTYILVAANWAMPRSPSYLSASPLLFSRNIRQRERIFGKCGLRPSHPEIKKSPAVSGPVRGTQGCRWGAAGDRCIFSYRAGEIKPVSVAHLTGAGPPPPIMNRWGDKARWCSAEPAF